MESFDEIVAEIKEVSEEHLERSKTGDRVDMKWNAAVSDYLRLLAVRLTEANARTLKLSVRLEAAEAELKPVLDCDLLNSGASAALFAVARSRQIFNQGMMDK